jgi:hypothetical protein
VDAVTLSASGGVGAQIADISILAVFERIVRAVADVRQQFNSFALGAADLKGEAPLVDAPGL